MNADASTNLYGRRASCPDEDRVQRRRAVTAAGTSLDAARATMAALADHSHHSGSTDGSDSSLNDSFFKRDCNNSSTARHDEYDSMLRRYHSDSCASYGKRHNSVVKRNCIVDAMLVQGTEETQVYDCKRRKVSLQWFNSPHDSGPHPSWTLEHGASNCASLQRVFEGTQSVRDHCGVLQRWHGAEAGYTAWTSSHDTLGTWLHAAALWNDHDVIRECLSWVQCQPDLENVLPCLLQARDGEERTPFTVALESGHLGVVEALALFGGQSQEPCSTSEYPADDDIMCFDRDSDNMSYQSNECNNRSMCTSIPSVISEDSDYNPTSGIHRTGSLEYASTC